MRKRRERQSKREMSLTCNGNCAAKGAGHEVPGPGDDTGSNLARFSFTTRRGQSGSGGGGHD